MKPNGLEIANLKDYILIELKVGINFLEIMRGIASLFTMSAYQEKSDIWVLANGNADFLYSDLHAIKSFAYEHYPETTKVQKTAIVIETELQRELANEYAKICEDGDGPRC